MCKKIYCVIKIAIYLNAHSKAVYKMLKAKFEKKISQKYHHLRLID